MSRGLLAVIGALCLGCQEPRPAVRVDGSTQPRVGPKLTQIAEKRKASTPFFDRLADAAVARSKLQVRYDPSYFRLKYPGGDPPAEVGVCTDEVIRSYRAVGVDLQKEVHEDMRSAFSVYPKEWGLSRPDPNIDHRRVPNLRTFFQRQGSSLPVRLDAKAFEPGDVVTWLIRGKLTHIGVVTNLPVEGKPDHLLIIHNIGAGPQLEDALFRWPITGHYRYPGPTKR